MVLNMGPVDWESRILPTRRVLRKGAFMIANMTNFSALPPAERVGGHCELAFLLLVVLLSITDLDMMYFLKKISPPSHVLEVCIYSHLQCFLR